MRSSHAIVAVNAWATAAFAISAALAASVFAAPFTAIAVVVDLVCFSAGVVAFLWGYWTAVQRSRSDDISVAGMYFLLGSVAPVLVVRRMNGLLGAQVVIGLATALARPSTDGKAGSTLAFGILVPMLGLGLNGLWASMHGAFPARSGNGADGVAHNHPPTGQDVSHD